MVFLMVRPDLCNFPGDLAGVGWHFQWWRHPPVTMGDLIKNRTVPVGTWNICTAPCFWPFGPTMRRTCTFAPQGKMLFHHNALWSNIVGDATTHNIIQRTKCQLSKKHRQLHSRGEKCCALLKNGCATYDASLVWFAKFWKLNLFSA
jgi:hypothetical protein